MTVLFVEALVALGLLVGEIARGRRIRHEDKLDRLVRLPIGQPQQGWTGGEIEPAWRHDVAELAGAGSGQVHGVLQRLAEVLFIVIAGQGQDGAAAMKKGLECLLQMADRFAKGVRSRQFAEQIAGDEQDIDFFQTAIVGHALDGFA